MSHSILVPERFILGAGSLNDLGKACARLGARPLVMTGRSALRKSGAIDRIVGSLGNAALFEEVEPEPSCGTVDRAREVIRAERCDVVIGAGGGSVMDAAKVAAGLANESAPTVEFWNGRKVERRGVPFVAIPTTSGTGAEATKNGVITNPEVPAKQSIRDDSFMAKLVVLDPGLTLSCPPEVTAHAGADALVQAIEAFTSVHASPMTDTWAFEAARLLKDAVLAAYRDGNDLDARTNAAYGSLFAGLALSNARLGMVHGLAHPLGARGNVPHGLVCAVLLPHVMRFNRDACREKYARLDHIMRGDCTAFVRRLFRDLGIPADLKSFGINRDLIGLMVEESLPSGSLEANPRKATAADCAAVFEAVL